jgi:NADPH:quinone reductase-like Zn-dependent oxidoreductase
MKLYRLQQFSGPAGLQMLESPIPEPGPREVLVRVRASSVNARDLMVAAGPARRSV